MSLEDIELTSLQRDISIWKTLMNLKQKDEMGIGPFRDQALYFSILLDSLIKAFGDGTETEITEMKDLAHKFCSLFRV